MDCLFSKGFDKATKCEFNTPSLEQLLAHVRQEHGAIAWGMGTLEKALKKARP